MIDREYKIQKKKLSIELAGKAIDKSYELLKMLLLACATNPVIGGLAAMTLNEVFYKIGFYTEDRHDGDTPEEGATKVLQSVGKWIVVVSTAYAGGPKPAISLGGDKVERN